jgi:hypothetical protein
MTIDHHIKNVMTQQPAEEPRHDMPADDGKNTKYLVWIILIIFVLVAAIVAVRYFVNTTERKGEIVEYNHYEFEKREGLWWSIWQNGNIQYILSLRYNPVQTLNTTINGALTQTFDQRDTIYVTFDPRPEDLSYVALSAAELSLNLANAMGVDVQAACTVNETEACATRPIIDCNTQNVSVILLQNINTTANIAMKNDCITLSGKDFELTRAVDRLLYTFYGIIPHMRQE